MFHLLECSVLHSPSTERLKKSVERRRQSFSIQWSYNVVLVSCSGFHCVFQQFILAKFHQFSESCFNGCIHSSFAFHKPIVV